MPDASSPPPAPRAPTPPTPDVSAAVPGGAAPWPPVPAADEPAVRLEHPAFGTLLLMRRAEGPTRHVPRQVVVAPDGPFAVETRAPASLRSRLLEAVRAEGAGTLAGALVADMPVLRHGQSFTVWTPSPGVPLDALRPARLGAGAGSAIPASEAGSGADAPADAALAAAFAAMARALLAEIDEARLLAAAREYLDVPGPERDAAGWVLTYDLGRTDHEPRAFANLEVVVAPHLGALRDVVTVTPEAVLGAFGAREVRAAVPPRAAPERVTVAVTEAPDADPWAGEAGFRGGRNRERRASAVVDDAGGHERVYWVRPAYEATSLAVQTAALAAGVPALLVRVPGGPVLRFDAERVSAVPLLHGVLAEALTLVPSTPEGLRAGPPVASVAEALLPPWDGIGLAGGDWVMTARPSLAAAVDAVRAATGHEPRRVYVGTSAVDVLRHPAVALSALRLGAAGPLPLAEYGTPVRRPFAGDDPASRGAPPQIAVDVRAYQQALRVALLAENGDPSFSPLVRVHERFAAAAAAAEQAVTAALDEARDLGAPADVLNAIRAPLAATLAALRAATVPRLLARSAGGAMFLAAVLGPLNAAAAPGEGAAEDGGTAGQGDGQGGAGVAASAPGESA